MYKRNIVGFEEPTTAWLARFGEEFPGRILPLGCQIFFEPSPTATMRIPKFAPNGVAGVFLGYEFTAGGGWSGDYLAVALEDFAKMDFRTGRAKGGKSCIRLQQTKEIFIEDWTHSATYFHFPFEG